MSRVLVIGSGSFIVACGYFTQTGSAGGLLLTWILTGLLTIVRGASYVTGCSFFARGRSDPFYLREAYAPLWGISFTAGRYSGDSDGTIAAVAVGDFAR